MSSRLPALPDAAGYRIPTRLGAIRVRELGDPQLPAALLWPSMFVDGHAWDPVIPELVGHRRLLVVDGPGYGGSDPLTRRSSIAECGVVAGEILDAVGVEAVDWVGNAWGGHVGMDLVVRRPERIRSLVAIGSPTHPVLGPGRIRLLLALLRLLGPVKPVVSAVLDAQFTVPNQRSAAADPVRRTLAATSRTSLVRTVQSFILDRVDVEASLVGVGVPALLVSTDDRGEWDPADAARVAAAMGDATHLVIHGSRTLVPLEQPETLASAILEFWASKAVGMPTA